MPNGVLVESTVLPFCLTRVSSVYRYGSVVDHSLGCSTRMSLVLVAPPTGSDPPRERPSPTTRPRASRTLYSTPTLASWPLPFASCVAMWTLAYPDLIVDASCGGVTNG